MPELPDVEKFRRTLASCGQNKLIRKVGVHDPGVLHDVSAPQFTNALEGRRFTEPVRHGKLLLARTGGPTVLLHFGMTGRLVCGTAEDRTHPHDRVVFGLGAGRELRYQDQRKLKGLWLLDDAEVARLLESQGPDAASADRDEVHAALSTQRGGIKSALTNQSVLSGLGNLLADEILWRARLDPRRRAALLTAEDHRRLYTALRDAVRQTVRAGCVPSRNTWLTGHRDATDGACPRCGHRLDHGRVTGRSTAWCSNCQPPPS